MRQAYANMMMRGLEDGELEDGEIHHEYEDGELGGHSHHSRHPMRIPADPDPLARPRGTTIASRSYSSPPRANPVLSSSVGSLSRRPSLWGSEGGRPPLLGAGPSSDSIASAFARGDSLRMSLPSSRSFLSPLASLALMRAPCWSRNWPQLRFSNAHGSTVAYCTPA